MSTTPAPDAAPLVAVRMTHVAKHFGPVRAVRDVTLEVSAGEIHALVGENGAGKSTLMHVLCGQHAPNAGRIEVFGRDVTGWSTGEAIAAGVGMVHQHFMLVPTLSVAENLVLGREPRRGVAFDRATATRDASALAARTGLTVPADALVASLSVGEAQRVEILKVLYRGARLLVLDEPTAVLSPPEVEELWGVLRRLRDDGATVIIITHKLDEVVAISDTITVMRDGCSVARMPTAGATPRDIARAMVGRDVALALDAAPTPAPTAAPKAGGDTAGGDTAGGDAAGGGADAAAPATARRKEGPAAAAPDAPLRVERLVARNDRGLRALDGVSFEVRAGEILGIAGVEGNGQSELLDVLAGFRKAEAGRVSLGDADLLALDVRGRADAGLSHIPEDRHRRGLVLDWSIADNLVLGRQHHFASRLGLDRGAVAAHAAEQVAAFDIRPPDASLPARALSGGNQQKVVIAREMGRDFRVLLAAQPTRGVDVGAIEFIHDRLRAARDDGKAILLVSADLAEVLALADRVAVLYEGRFACLLPAAECSAARLGPFMTGAGAEAAA